MGSWGPEGSFYGDSGDMRHGGDCSGTILLFKEGWACDGCEAGDDYPGNELVEEEPAPPLLIFESMKGFADLDKMEWDTSLPELDAPWPHHVPENLDLRSMVSWLSGRPDATKYLYELAELEEYERTGMVPWADDVTALMEAVE